MTHVEISESVREEIHSLMSEIAWAFDAEESEPIAAVVTEDCQFIRVEADGRKRQWDGREQVATWVADCHARAALTDAQNWGLGLRMHLDGGDVIVEYTTTELFIVRGVTSLALDSVAIVEDRFRQSHSGWLLARRTRTDITEARRNATAHERNQLR